VKRGSRHGRRDYRSSSGGETQFGSETGARETGVREGTSEGPEFGDVEKCESVRAQAEFEK